MSEELEYKEAQDYHQSELVVTLAKYRQLEDELAEMRQAMSRVATNVGNGSFATADASHEWMTKEVPEEVRHYCNRIRRELAAVTADLEFRRELGALQQQEYDKVTDERDALKGELAELEDITGDFKPDKDSDSSGTLIERVRAIVYMAGRELTETKIEADTMRQHHANAESVIVASQQEVWRLREALEWAMSAVNPSPCRCISFVEPPHICIGHAALSSTPAPVQKDTERLDWLEKNQARIFGLWFDNTNSNVIPKTWSITANPTDSFSGGENLGEGETIRRAIDAAIDAELARKEQQ